MRKYLSLLVLLAIGLLSTGCLLPGMIPLTGGIAGPRPAMEKSIDKVIQVLQGQNYIRLEALAKEQYTQEDYSKPGTLTFTVKITDKVPTYFSFNWCAADEPTLQQNVQHLKVRLYFNGAELGTDVVHTLSFTSSTNLPCANFGVLMSDWPAGQYKLKSVATFDQSINDGFSDFAAGDYIHDFTVDVQP